MKIEPHKVATVVLRRQAGLVQVLLVGSNSDASFRLPQGEVASAETPAKAAIRHTRAQTGLAVRLVGEEVYLGTLSGPRPATAFFPAQIDPAAEGVHGQTGEWMGLTQTRRHLAASREWSAIESCMGRSELPRCLLVDADGCPRNCLRIAEELACSSGWPLITVASFNHNIQRTDGGEHVGVGDEAEATDIAVANRLLRGDILITQDYGLAALALGKGAPAISPGGRIFTADNIDFLLTERHLKAAHRRQGGRTRGPAPRRSSDDTFFRESLDHLLQQPVARVHDRS